MCVFFFGAGYGVVDCLGVCGGCHLYARCACSAVMSSCRWSFGEARHYTSIIDVIDFDSMLQVARVLNTIERCSMI